jgi:hypothetical protein
VELAAPCRISTKVLRRPSPSGGDEVNAFTHTCDGLLLCLPMDTDALTAGLLYAATNVQHLDASTW